MPRYLLKIDREVTTWDRFYRVVEAETFGAARAIGDKLASEANRSCPDDAGPSDCDTELGDWFVNDAEEATEADVALHGVEGEDD